LHHSGVQNKPAGLRQAVASKDDGPILKERRAMRPSLRSFIGTIAIIVIVLLYALLATTIASATLATAPWWAHLLYFVLTGLLWIVPALLIIKWMAGPARK
jgi:hypothetical protein